MERRLLEIVRRDYAYDYHNVSRLSWTVLAIWLAGCASNSHRMDDPAILPRPRLPKDTLVLEIAFVDVPVDVAEQASLWSEIDEQHFSPASRRRLTANGFRCGIIGNKLPPRLLQRLSSAGGGDGGAGFVDVSQIDFAAHGKNRQIHLRSGGTGEIVTGDIRDELVVLTSDDQRVIGQTFHSAQTVFDLTAHILPGGEVQLQLEPVILHGNSQQKIVGGEGTGAWRFESSRQRAAYNHLKIQATLLPGQFMAVTTMGSGMSLGGQFFSSARQDGPPKMLLIRHTHAEPDDLFPDPAG